MRAHEGQQGDANASTQAVRDASGDARALMPAAGQPLSSMHVLALQRMAGNRAATAYVRATGRPAVRRTAAPELVTRTAVDQAAALLGDSGGLRVQRQHGGSASQETADETTEPQFRRLDLLRDVTEDPAELLRRLPTFVEVLRTIEWDDEARAAGATDALLRPVGVVVVTERHRILCDGQGRPAEVQDIARDDWNTSGTSGIVLLAPQVGFDYVWFHAPGWTRLVGAEAGEPADDVEPGTSVLLFQMPGIVLPPALIRAIRETPVGEGGEEGASGAPDWADDQVEQLRSAGIGGTGSEGTGPGAGEEGTGSGGGEGPLKGTPAFDAEVCSDGHACVKITLDRARIWLRLLQGESPERLRRRVERRIATLQQWRDPERFTHVRHGAETTGFTKSGRRETGRVLTPEEVAEQTPDGARSEDATTEGTRTGSPISTPEERAPGGQSIANAMPYPATITMSGHTGDQAPITTAGAANQFTMTLHYAARSIDTRDEVFNRLQPVHFYWELIDVSDVAIQQRERHVQSTKLGEGERQGIGSGVGGDLRRDFEAIAEDQEADLRMMAEEDWPWAARAAYLQVIGISNVVRSIGSLVSAYVDIITKPLNERSVGFDRPGDYVLRCVATPRVSDEAKEDPANHVIRSSSIAVLPIRVETISTRAANVADAEANQLRSLENELTRAQEGGDEAAIQLARARLEAARRGAAMSGFEAYTTELEALAAQREIAGRLRERLREGTPEEQWREDELTLQLGLLLRGQTVDEYLRGIGASLAHLRGRDGGHERWVRRQHGRFQPVGGRTDFRPRLALASEENGQVAPLRTMLGELAGSRDGRRRWALVDFTSGSSRDTYEGASSQTGHAGHVEAIRDALRNLAENGGYGRGTLAIRLPQELDEALGQPVTIERAMRSAPGPWARVRQRLTDLATTLEVAALFATGGASLGLSIAGGISGAVVAVDSLARRRRTDHVWEAGTIFDVLGVIGGATSVIGPLARQSGGVDDILRLYGKVDNVQQVISIPAQTAIEIHQVLGDSNLSEGERRSRAALALLKGIRSGAVTIAQMRGGLVAEEGLPPRADDDTGARPPGDETGAGPLPEGHRADDAEGVADGRRPPVPPDRPLPGEDGSGTTVPDERPDGSGRTPSARDLVDEAQQLGRERLRESLDAELRPPEPDDAMAGGRTAAGTGSAGRTGVDEGLDVGAAERARRRAARAAARSASRPRCQRGRRATSPWRLRTSHPLRRRRRGAL